MGRPIKDSVEYFPHYVNQGKTIFILEQKYGNDGYSFWFKVLELLASAEGHVYDCNNEADWLYLQAKTHLSEDISSSILDTLCNAGAIDKELWAERKIWSQNLVNNLQPVYANRRRTLPLKPVITCRNNTAGELLHVEIPSQVDSNMLSTIEMPQSIVEEVEEVKEAEDSKEDATHSSSPDTMTRAEHKDTVPYSEIVELWNTFVVSLPAVQRITDARKKAIKARFNENGKDRDFFRSVFVSVEASDFLTGKTSSSTFKASFDWVMCPSNWAKIIEGNYANKGKARQMQIAGIAPPEKSKWQSCPEYKGRTEA